VNILTKPRFCLAWDTCTENQGHRLSEEEARHSDKTYNAHKWKNWISSETAFQPRKSADTDRSVRESQEKPTKIPWR